MKFQAVKPSKTAAVESIIDNFLEEQKSSDGRIKKSQLKDCREFINMELKENERKKTNRQIPQFNPSN